MLRKAGFRVWGLQAVLLCALLGWLDCDCEKVENELGIGSGLALHLDVCVDVSASDHLREHLALDSAFVAELVRRLPARSAMHLFAIHAAAEWQEPVLRVEMPRSAGPMRRAVEAAWRENLRALASAWRKMAHDAEQQGYQYESDIVGMLDVLAEHQRDRKAQRKVIVLLSDMQDVRKGRWNFEKQKPGLALLRRWQEEGLIPDLRGTQVYVFRFWPAHGVRPEHYRAIRRFWEAFFKRSHADLRAFRAQREVDLVLKRPRKPFEVE